MPLEWQKSRHYVIPPMYLENFEYVESDICITQSRIESSVLRVVDILANQAHGLGGGILHQPFKPNDIHTAFQILEDLDLTFDLAASNFIVAAVLGFKILTTHLASVLLLMPSKTSLYLPRPSLRTNS